MLFDKNNLLTYKNIENLFDDLYPLCRSICGPDFKKSLQILKEYIPFDIIKFPSGSKVLDWVIPQEWEAKECYVCNPKGKKIIDFKECNLHLLNYSDSFEGMIDLKDLSKNIHVSDTIDTAIPYVTSYYKNRWGVCMSSSQKNTLYDGEYFVKIETKKFDGTLDLGITELSGSSDLTVMFTTYLCHPSMGNNELSGPLSMVLLYNMIKKIPNRFYNYKFLVGPETIGSLAYLSKYGKELKKNLIAGYVLTCLGGNKKTLKIKKSRNSLLANNYLIDNVTDVICKYDSGFKKRPFTPTSGSDERQFCSPGFNLPFNQISRTTYLEYKEYHTNLDNKEFMNINNIFNSAENIFKIVELLEFTNKKLVNKYPYGEPFLSSKNLYPDLSKHEKKSKINAFTEKELFLILLSYSMNKNLLEIAKLTKISPLSFIDPLKKLIDHKLIGIKK